MDYKRKRIAVLVGQADESYQRRFLEGFLEQAFGFEMDVCVFSMYRKYQDTKEREKGDSNILFLMNPEKFDGVVYLKDCIQTTGMAEKVEEWLHENFHGPVLVIEKDSPYFPSVCSDGYTPVVVLVNHLIEEHGFQDIAFLTGKRWHPHSQQRLEAYREALRNHGIEPREEYEIYGDFWYKSGEHCAEYLLSLDFLPQAVVCANDPMAIGLCGALEAHDIRVPEDIVVVGYDSTEEGQTSPKTITSAVIPAKEVGIYSANYMQAQFDSAELMPFHAESQLMIGESCGCEHTTMPSLTIRRKEWDTEISSEGYYSVNNMMSEFILEQTSLSDYLAAVHSYAYQVKGADSVHICLNEQWKDIDTNADIEVPNEGYSENMIYAMRYRKNRKGSKLGVEETFPSSVMLPDLDEYSETPRVFYFTPLFSNTQCYGYAVVGYGDQPRSFDDVYRNWISTVARSFESLRRFSCDRILRTRIEQMQNNKFAGPKGAYETLKEEEKQDYDLVRQILDENLLTYHYQPIVRTTDGSIYSYEALMRSKTEKRISPLDIIKYAEMQGRLTDVERATFLNVLGQVDEEREKFGGAKVFINSIPGVRMYSAESGEIEQLLMRNSKNTVVELTEEAELSDEALKQLKAFYEKLNIEIAIDDYGTGYSNVNNLLRYMPNYVKIDRALLSEIQDAPQKQHFVREVIEFCHDNNIMALAEGVETTAELQTVIHLGADLIQGYYTAKPAPEPLAAIDEKVRNEIKTYHQEKADGVIRQNYIAGMTNRITLSNLVKEGCTDIVVGHGNMVYKDLTIIGTPQMQTDIHIRIEPGYDGVITLENVMLSNIKHRPCIDIGDNAKVILVLQGDNVLNESGIRVAETSSLTFEGDGDLLIKLTASEYFGIGNDFASGHGTIDFEQDGEISIRTSGRRGIFIGSGKGGNIIISRGQYVLKGNGEYGIGIGSQDGIVTLDIVKCMINIDLNTTNGIFIGSVNNYADISISNTAIHCNGGGTRYVGIGSLDGQYTSLFVKESSLDINLRSGDSTCLGALRGTTEFTSHFADLTFENAGKNALIIGGTEDQGGHMELRDTTFRAELHSSMDQETMIEDDQIRVINGRYKVMVNDEKVNRRLEYLNV